MTMDVDTSKNPTIAVDKQLEDIISYLTFQKDISFKNQQKWEPDLTREEKFNIALELFKSNKLNFLIKFGKYLINDQLSYFHPFTSSDEPDWEEMKVVLSDLGSSCSIKSRQKVIKNRRYEALRQMVEDDSYFSEIEMMKRNPLLYEQLVGQYMSIDEKQARDKYKLDDQCTFVKILMEGIERDNAEAYRKRQAEDENNQEEEEDEEDSEDSSNDEDLKFTNLETSAPSTSRWGEFEEGQTKTSFGLKQKPKQNLDITAQERSLLKEEFITTMYRSFLDGKDEDFNYNDVDNNTSYDNLEEMDNDEEEKYFESEEAEEGVIKNEEVSSEDELDIYMNALTQHPAVNELSKDFKRM